jgi:hypothetical protein
MSLLIHIKRAGETVRLYRIGPSRARFLADQVDELGLTAFLPWPAMDIVAAQADSALADLAKLEAAHKVERGQWGWLRLELADLKAGEVELISFS